MYSWLYIKKFKSTVGRNHTNVMSVQLDILETLTNILEPTVNSWEKPYQYDVCLARFIKESEQKTHSRTHSERNNTNVVSVQLDSLKQVT